MPVSNPPTVDPNALFDEFFAFLPKKSELSPDEKRFALIAEVQRIGLCQLYEEGGRMPVHQLSLRRWVQRKLEPLIPHLFSEEQPDYRDVLLDGRGTPGSLDFLGDVISVSQAGLCPAPTRAIPITHDSYVLASGLPTLAFEGLALNIRLSSLSRRLVNIDEHELKRRDIPIMAKDAFLRGTDDGTGSRALIDRILARAPETSAIDKTWRSYQGYQPGRFDFQWDNRQKKYFFPRSGNGPTLVMWEESLGPNGRARWLARADRPLRLHPVEPLEWKRLCIALDQYEGNARQARISKGADAAWLYLTSRPWLALYRWLLVAGAQSRKRPATEQGWRLPIEAVESIADILRSAGVTVQIEEEA